MRKLLLIALAICACAWAGGPNDPYASGPGGRSAATVASSTPTPSAPDAPTLTVAGVTTSTISLSWTDESGSGATSYEVDLAEDASFSTGRMVLTATTTTAAALSVTGQPAGVALWARVRAVGAGGTSASSGVASGTLGTVVTNDGVLLQWTAGAYNRSTGVIVDSVGSLGANASQATVANRPIPSSDGLYLQFNEDDAGVATKSYVTAASPITFSRPYSIVVKTSLDSTTGGQFIWSCEGNYNLCYIPANNWIRWYAGSAEYAYTPYTATYTRVYAQSINVGSATTWTDLASHTYLSTTYDSAAFTINRYNSSGGNQANQKFYFARVLDHDVTAAEIASYVAWIPAPIGPTLEPITASTTTSLVASWPHLTGVSSYRLDCATDPAMLTGYLPGYESRIVATSSASGLTIDATGYTGQTVYLRLRSAGAGGIGPSTATTAAVIP